MTTGGHGQPVVARSSGLFGPGTDVTDRPNLLAGVQDFWMFDRAEVVLMRYDPDGTQISREAYEGDVASLGLEVEWT